MTLKNRTAIVGLGATPYYRRGQSHPQSMLELGGKAILAAVQDAGLEVRDINGFAYYSGGFDTALLMESLGIPEVRYSAMVTSGGGGSVGAIGLAASAIVSGMADTVCVVFCMQQPADKRYGSIMSRVEPTPDKAFYTSAGLVGPGHFFALLAQRHMHLYGTRRDAFAEVAISSRLNAIKRPEARFTEPLTREEYFAAPMIADPLCRYDFCLENDIAIAVILTSAERARDLRQKPVYVMGAEQGGRREWGRAIASMNMSDDYFASAGYASVAQHLYRSAGIGVEDIDVAELYDHFSPMVVMQLEDFGFCPRGEGGAFVEAGNIRFEGGSIPVNTHGGHLSEAYAVGMTHVREAIEQIRGTAINQVKDARIALVSGGPATLPISGLLLGSDAHV